MFKVKLLIDTACMFNGFMMAVNVIELAIKIILAAPALLMTVIVFTAGNACMSMVELLSKLASFFVFIRRIKYCCG